MRCNLCLDTIKKDVFLACVAVCDHFLSASLTKEIRFVIITFTTECLYFIRKTIVHVSAKANDLETFLKCHVVNYCKKNSISLMLR